MALTEAFEACIRTLEREYRDLIIHEQSSFSAQASERGVVNSGFYPQGLANIARKAALEFARNATEQCASVQDLTDANDVENAQQHLLNAAKGLLGTGQENALMPALNAPANMLRAHASSELQQEIQDRLVIVQEKRRARGNSSASSWTLLFLVSHPRDGEYISTNSEGREARQAIREAEYRDQIFFVVEPAVRIRDLFKSVNEHHPRVIHFSGHGSQSCLALLDDHNKMREFDAAHLAELITATGDSVELVVLNSCDSLPQAKKLMKAVPHAIGTKGPLDDDAAVVFSRTFYCALAHGKSIESSFRQALVAVSAETGLVAADLFGLCSQESCDPKQTALVSLASTEPKVKENFLSEDEIQLLRAVGKGGDYLVLESNQTGKWIRAGDTDFHNPEDASYGARLRDAFDLLIDKGLILHEVGVQYRLTGKGWSVKNSFSDMK